MFFTDWEGPWILTDFALELSMAVFNNPRFFRNLSHYDDYLAYELKRDGYEAGYTLKLLVPFLVAAGVDNSKVSEIAEMTARFVPEAKEAMARLQKKWKPVVISTSYTQYLEKTASMVGVKGHLHGTSVNFDEIGMKDELKEHLLKSIDRIASLEGRELFEYLDDLFSSPQVYTIFKNVRAIGAGEKAEILRRYCEEYGVEFPVAIGDSISDYKMFEAARRMGGVAVAFNGNEYALKHADIAIVSPTAMSEAIVVETLLEGGRIEDLPKIEGTKVYIMEEADFDEVLEKSKRMRVKLRGLAGELG